MQSNLVVSSYPSIKSDVDQVFGARSYWTVGHVLVPAMNLEKQMPQASPEYDRLKAQFESALKELQALKGSNEETIKKCFSVSHFFLIICLL